ATLRGICTSTQPAVSRTVEGVHRRKDGSTFPVEMHLTLLEQGTPQLVIAIARDITERKRSEEVLVSYQGRLESLLKGSLELSRIQSVESLLARIGEACAQMLRADGGDFRVVEGDELVVVATWGDQGEIGSAARLRIGEGFSGLMAARGEPLIIRDPGESDQVHPRAREAFRRLGHRAWLGVPVKRGDRLMATLNMWCRAPQGFSEEDVTIARAFAAQAAAAIENAQLFAESQRELRERQAAEETLARRTRQLEAVKAVGEEITRELDVEALLDLLASSAAPLVRADVGTIFLWDEASQLLRPRGWLGPAQPADDRPRRLGEGVTGAAAQRRTGLLVNDFPRSPYALDYILAQAPVAAVLAQPFFSRGSLIGVFSFSKRGDPAATFTPEDQAILSLLAPQAAIAVENARLYEAARRTAEALRESEEHQRITLQSIGDAVIATDRAARVVQMNPVAEALTGWEHSTAAGRHLDEVFRIVNAKSREPLASPAAKVLETRGRIGLANDTLLIARDGTERQIADSGAPIRSADGEIVGVVLVFRDVTAEYATREQLRHREEQFRTIFETSPFSIAINRMRDGAFVKVNPAFERLSGYREAEVVGRTGFEIGLYLFEDESRSNLEILEHTGRIENVQTICLRNTGERRQVLFSSARMEFGGEPCVLSVTIDVTETKRLEEQLRQAQKMEVIGQLAGGVAHDFNNMLSVIIGSAELLSVSLPPDSPEQEKVGVILEGTQRAADLIRKLLAFSRKGKVVSTPLDVHEQIRAAIDLLERSIDRRIQILTRFEATNPIVIGDPTLLQNAMMNLGVNARDAMPDGGTLSFATTNVTLTQEDLDGHLFDLVHDLEPGPFVEVRISDTGAGIPAEIIPRIFEPFFTTKDVGKGTGLGLAAVFGTVREHRGTLRVQSEPGHGTTFSIFLPAQDGARAAAPVLPEQVVPGSGCVLLVDDEALVRTSSQALLSMLGYDVLLAEEGEMAVEIYRRERERVDVVLLDMVMPKLSGRETFLRLREIDPAVRVVFSSGFSDDQRIDELLQLGAKGFIQKPYPFSALSKVIAEALGKT
ncbi:MAG: PAS domain S-box protein, partial [candidate division NC10 bacterium]|nr:PAS domain S-box protein [candidate division NC10 bacterium]